jgi:hypothetical protein
LSKGPGDGDVIERFRGVTLYEQISNSVLEGDEGARSNRAISFGRLRKHELRFVITNKKNVGKDIFV